MALVVKNLHPNTGDLRDMGSGSGRFPGEGHGNTDSSILARKIPWTEEPGRLQSVVSRVGQDRSNLTHMHACVYMLIPVSQFITSPLDLIFSWVHKRALYC